MLSENYHLKVIALEAVANAVTNNLQVSQVFIKEGVLMDVVYNICQEPKLSEKVLMAVADIFQNFSSLELIHNMDSGVHQAYAVSCIKNVLYCDKSSDIQFKGLVTVANLFNNSNTNPGILMTFAKEKVIRVACQ